MQLQYKAVKKHLHIVTKGNFWEESEVRDLWFLFRSVTE